MMEKKGNKYKVLCDVMIIFVYTTKYDAKKLQHSYAQLKMENSKTFTSKKKINCKNYQLFSKGLCLFPKQFITSLAPQTKNK
jgi:hypothetical protein